ncbi:MAG: hypothetical protein HY709_11255 [Candidatus Latescibacteria bacterium]|nr:hypothetical protein [Candidatus Latescibacterota bacterium]
MLQQLSPSVYWWSELHGAARNQPYYWNSYLIHVKKANVLALVDPLPLSVEEIQEIEALGPPTHILLTCYYHLRESETYRQKWGCPIYLHQVGLEEAEVSIDRTFQDGESLWNAVDLIHLPDVVSYPEETVFLVREGGGVLIIGDALSGGRPDRGILDGELGISFPEYVTNPQKARQSLSKLLEYSFEVMCFGHGSPIFTDPQEALRRFLDRADFWNPLLQCTGEQNYSLMQCGGRLRLT